MFLEIFMLMLLLMIMMMKLLVMMSLLIWWKGWTCQSFWCWRRRGWYTSSSSVFDAFQFLPIKPLKHVNSGELLKCLAPCCWDSFNQQYPRLGKVSHQPRDAIGWSKNNDSSGQSSGLTQDRARASWLALHFFMETCAWNDATNKTPKKMMFQGPGVIDVTQIPDLSWNFRNACIYPWSCGS